MIWYVMVSQWSEVLWYWPVEELSLVALLGKNYLASPAVAQQFDIWIGKGEIPRLYRVG